MDKRIPGLALLALAIAVVLSITACSKSAKVTPIVSSIAITPTATSVATKSTVQFTATVTLQNGKTSSSTAVTWQVNGTTGGNSTVGTIASSGSNTQVATYTAPAAVPAGGQVNITATAPADSSSSSSATITSNTAIVTITQTYTLVISPQTATVPAGGSHQYSATLNGVADPNATWTLSSANGGVLGTIDATGLYTAPSFPPPGASVTITAQDLTVTPTATATTTAVVVYSDQSLKGPFAFSYTGNDSSGFLAAAGSFVSDGNGHITSGVEDVSSYLTGVSTQVPFSGTYVVKPDGRTSASITTAAGTSTWQFVMTTNLHALMTRFDTSATGGGTIDQQNLNALVVSDSVLTGPYVFGVSGSDSLFTPAAVAGEFSADGAGTIPATATILDLNDGGSISTGDTTLHGTYSFDAAFPGSGRGTIALTSASTGTLQYAFYVVDSTHAHLLEIDSNAFLAGDMFSGPGGTFSNASLTPGNYVFTNGGTKAAGAYAAGGDFVSDGAGNVTAGTLDTNTGGTATTNTTISACAYTVAPATGRIDLKLYTGSGACPAAPAANLKEFAVYQTAQGSAVMLELDAAAVATGMAYQQQVTPTSIPGDFALGVFGQGVFHNSPASYQTDTAGQVTITASSVTSGNLDINNYNAVFAGDPITSTGSSVGAPGTRGRGTLVLHATGPAVTYNLIYYLIDANTALLFDQDTTRIATGFFAKQF